MTVVTDVIDPPSKWNAHEIRQRLRAYHEGPEWVIQFEVGNSTGGHVKRHADAVAMSIWPSRGYKIFGYEIKVSRSDWLSELKNPQKAEEVGQYCDAWFIVSPPDIVNEVEIPDTWGWMVPAGKSLRIRKQPVVKKVTELSRGFVAAMLRRGHDDVDHIVADKVRRLRLDDEKTIRERVERELQGRSRQYTDLKKAVEEFEEQSGIKIDRYGGGNIGKKVKLVTAMRDGDWDGIPYVIKALKRATEGIEAAHRDFIGNPEEE